MAENWLKIIIEGDPGLMGAITDYLVGILDAGVEEAAPDEPEYGRVQAYVQRADLSTEEESRLLQQLQTFLAEVTSVTGLPEPTIRTERIENRDWSSSWKEHFHPFSIVPGLVIVPSWEEYSPQPGEQVLVLDPGMAFGTGHHATTSLCLTLIREVLGESEVDTMLDVGTGTGILGMGAIHLGAGSVLGIDNDPEAVRVASQNVQVNGMADRMTVSGADLKELQGGYRMVVANIVHDVLLELASELDRLTSPGGQLILSGLMGKKQVADLREWFLSRRYEVRSERYDEEWGALRLEKKIVS